MPEEKSVPAFEQPVIEFSSPHGTITITVPTHWPQSMVDAYSKFVGEALNYDSWPEELKRRSAND